MSDGPQSVTEAIAEAHSNDGYGFDAEVVEDAPVVEAPPAEEVDDIDLLIEDGDETPPAGETPPVEEAADPFAEFGGIESVRSLQTIQNAFKTEAGLRSITANALYALDYTPAEVQAFLNRQAHGVVEAPAPAEPVADPLADIDDEDVVTGAQAKALAQTLAKQAAQEAIAEAMAPLQQREVEARQVQATATVDSTLISLLGDPSAEDPASTVDPATAQRILVAAGKYLQPDDWNPANIKAAIERGHADEMAAVEAEVQKRIAAKKATKAKQPTSIGDSIPGAGEGAAPEPKNIAEAIKLARQGNYGQ